MYVCMYVCMYVRMYVYIYIYIYIYVKVAHCHDSNARYIKVTLSSYHKSCVKTELQPSKVVGFKLQILPSTLKSIHARIVYRGWRYVKN
jgi:hypothetical protein